MTGRHSRILQVGLAVAIVGGTSIVAALSLVNILRWSGEPSSGYMVRATGRAPTVGFVLTGGADAGLKVGDRLLAVNGMPVTSLGAIRAIRRMEFGATNTYTVQRGDGWQDVTIRTQSVGLRDGLMLFGVPWLVGVIFVVLGSVVFLMKPFGGPSWAFLLFSCVAGVFVLFMHRNVLSPAWLNTASITSLGFLPAVMLHLGLTFPEERSWLVRRRWALFAPYVASLVLTGLLRTTSPIWEDIPVSLKIGWLSYLAVAVAALLGATAYTHWTTASSVTRLRARVILLGFAVATCLPVEESALNTVFDLYVLPHSSWLVPFFVFVPLSVGYAIVKHNLFDIDAVIRRSTGWLLLTGVIVALYAALLAGFDHASRRWATGLSPLSGLLTVLILIALLNPLRDRVQALVDRIFYRTPSDYQKTVRAMSEALTSVISLDVVIDRLITALTEEMFIGRVAVLLRQESTGGYAGYRVEGGRGVMADDLALDASSPIVQLLSSEKIQVLNRDVVAEDPEFTLRPGDLLGDFDRLSATLLIPLVFNGELIGILAVGDKLSGRTYTAEDVALLTTLAHESAIAIHNATAFKRIEDLTLTLEDRVRERTEELATLNVKLEASNQRLRELDQLKSDFVLDVAHELGTPLTSISGYLEYVLDGSAGTVATTQRGFLERARNNAGRLRRLITDLLDLARIEAGQVGLRRVQVHLADIVDGVMDDLRASASEKSIAFSCEGVDLMVSADPDKLHQILLNLVHNAVKFTASGGSVVVRAARGCDGAVAITVQDTGEGIGPEDIGRVFDKFVRAGDPEPIPTGSGLGLTITRRLVELHGGSITVTSEPGRGSAFVVTLPRVVRVGP